MTPGLDHSLTFAIRKALCFQHNSFKYSLNTCTVVGFPPFSCFILYVLALSSMSGLLWCRCWKTGLIVVPHHWCCCPSPRGVVWPCILQSHATEEQCGFCFNLFAVTFGGKDASSNNIHEFLPWIIKMSIMNITFLLLPPAELHEAHLIERIVRWAMRFPQKMGSEATDMCTCLVYSWIYSASRGCILQVEETWGRRNFIMGPLLPQNEPSLSLLAPHVPSSYKAAAKGHSNLTASITAWMLHQ